MIEAEIKVEVEGEVEAAKDARIAKGSDTDSTTKTQSHQGSDNSETRCTDARSEAEPSATSANPQIGLAPGETPPQRRGDMLYRLQSAVVRGCSPNL